MRPVNELRLTLAEAYTHGTSTYVAVAEDLAALIAAGELETAGVVRVFDDAEWVLLRYAGVDTANNRLTDLSAAAPRNASENANGHTFAVGSSVWGAPAVDYVNIHLDDEAPHGGTTVGVGIYRLPNPSAIRFLRVNADNTVSALTAAEMTTAIGAVHAAGVAGGQTIIGGTVADDVLTLQGNSATGNSSTARAIRMLVGENGATEAITVLNNGNVGIGTTAPEEKLHVYESVTRNVLQFGAYGAVGSIWSSADYFFGNNAKADPSGTNALVIMKTHATLGARAIRMGGSLGGIEFHAKSGSVTAGETFNSPVMKITNDGNVGIGTTSPDASAILDLTSTNKGFLPPRMTSTQRGEISSPATGLVVYDTTLNKLCVYAGSAWRQITDAAI